MVLTLLDLKMMKSSNPAAAADNDDGDGGVDENDVGVQDAVDDR